MLHLEFERKFVLDLRKAVEIEEKLTQQLLFHSGSRVVLIRQCYSGTGDRYRAISGRNMNLNGNANNQIVTVIESKKNIPLGTVFAVNIEDEISITVEEFNQEWEKCPRRVQKVRYEFPMDGQRLVVDFFVTANQYYAIIAEVESILDKNSKALKLDFALPKYLEPYLLLAVDNQDPNMKMFRSSNLVDTPETIAHIKKELNKLYGNTV